MQLQRLVGDGEARVGGDALRHGAERRCIRRARIERRRRPPEQGARGFELRRHVGKLELQRLKFIETPSKGLALAHIERCAVERALGRRRASRRRYSACRRPSAAIAILKPCPSPPRRFRDGTRQSSKLTAWVGCAFQPIFLSAAPSVRPGVPPSTSSAETPPEPSPPVRAITMIDMLGAARARAGNELLFAVQDIIVATPLGPRA